MFIQFLWHVLHQCTGCTANGSVGMIEIPISHPDESFCCQVFEATDWLRTFGHEHQCSGMPNKFKKEAYRVRHVQGVLPSSEACSATGSLAFFLQSRHLCRLKPRHRVDHLSCIGKAFHNMDSIDQTIACHRLSFVTWHASCVWLNVEPIT